MKKIQKKWRMNLLIEFIPNHSLNPNQRSSKSHRRGLPKRKRKIEDMLGFD